MCLRCEYYVVVVVGCRMCNEWYVMSYWWGGECCVILMWVYLWG